MLTGPASLSNVISAGREDLDKARSLGVSCSLCGFGGFRILKVQRARRLNDADFAAHGKCECKVQKPQKGRPTSTHQPSVARLNLIQLNHFIKAIKNIR